MILDSLKNFELYLPIHPQFKRAFEFLIHSDLQTLPLGKTELDGKNLIVNVVEIAGKTTDEVKMETHQKYIDIQIPISTTETMGWIAGNRLSQPIDLYNIEKDVAFFADKAANYINVELGEFVVFFPDDGHQPGIAEGQIKKIIIKVLV